MKFQVKIYKDKVDMQRMEKLCAEFNKQAVFDYITSALNCGLIDITPVLFNDFNNNYQERKNAIDLLFLAVKHNSPVLDAADDGPHPIIFGINDPDFDYLIVQITVDYLDIGLLTKLYHDYNMQSYDAYDIGEAICYGYTYDITEAIEKETKYNTDKINDIIDLYLMFAAIQYIKINS